MIHVSRVRPALAALLLLLATVGLVAAPPASAGPGAAAGAGADMSVSLSGPRTVRLGDDITYTITGTNVGGQTATGVQLSGMVEDWFDPRAMDCRGGTVSPDNVNTCDFGDVAPGETVSLTLTMTACCPERHMFQFAWVSSTNDVNPDNDSTMVKLNFRGPKH
jgi:hypothetical protein